jgi:DNA-binding SARP family transcriptional activator
MPTLHLYGSPQLRLDAERRLPLSARDASLLAWLALQGPTPRARLALLFWPDARPEQARGNLRQQLLRLRRHAGDVVTDADGLLRLGEGLALAPPEPESGELLAGVDIEAGDEFLAWLDAQREADTRTRRESLLTRARRALEAGDLDLVLAETDALLREDAAQEEAHRLRMQAFYLRGDRAAAIAAWDDCKLALRAAFGVTPSQATTELGQLLLASDTAAPAAARSLPASLRRPPQRIDCPAASAPVEQAWALEHALLLAGPGGIGKSRWLDELAARSLPALRGAAQPGDAPGALLQRLLQGLPTLGEAERQALAPLLPGTAEPDPAGAAAAQRRALATLVQCLQQAAAEGLRSLVIDDLQALDPLSRFALQALLRAWLAGELPLRLLMGARLHELDAAGEALLEPLRASGRCLVQRLEGLNADQLHALLQGLALPLDPALLPALAEALHRHLGGNPAFVLESLKALWQAGLEDWRPGDALPVPPSLRESVLRRLRRLSAEGLQLAQLAAVARAQFSVPLAAQALQRSTLALAPLFSELESAQVFEAGRFAHDLVAEAVGASLPDSLRPSLHRQVAELLIALKGDAQGIADHLDAAGSLREAAAWHRRAADQATERWQLELAAAGYTRAAQGLDPAQDRADRLRAWRDAARSWNGINRYAEASAALAEAAALASSDAEHLAVLSSQLVTWLNTRRYAPLRGAADALAARLSRSLQRAEVYEREDLMRTLAVLGAASRAWRPQPEFVAALLAFTEGLHGDDDPGSWNAQLGMALIDLHQGRPGAALARVRDGLPRALAWRRHNLVQNLGQTGVPAALRLGDADEAERLLGLMAASLRDSGLGPVQHADHLALRAQLLLMQGQPAQARRLIDAQTAQLEASGLLPPLRLLAVEAAAALRLEDWDAARDRLARSEARLRDDGLPSLDLARLAGLQAWLQAAQGEDPSASLALAQAADPAARPGGAPALEARVLAHQLAVQPVDAATLRAWAEEAEREGLQPLARHCRRLAGDAAPAGLQPAWLPPLP